MPIMAQWRDGIVAHLEAGGLSALQEWQASVKDDEQLAAAIFRTRLQADMAGQLFVRAVEVPETLPTRVLARLPDDRPSFMRLTFREALDAFLARRLIGQEEYAELSAIARRDSFSAVNLASEQLVERARQLVERHIADGGTLRSFTAGMRSGEISIGIEPATPAYLENVFRTNVQSSYGAGRLRQMEHPAVVSARPLVQYRTARDNRVRQAHAALHGVIFDRENDPGWRAFAPPLGYQCRCSIVTLRDGDRSQIRHSSEFGGVVFEDGSSIDPSQFAGPGVT